MSIELPIANRHCRDMTEKLLKATLNFNKLQQQQQYKFRPNVIVDEISHQQNVIVDEVSYQRSVFDQMSCTCATRY